ncbi:MAG: protein-glutamate O-methyltransferase CheR [Spongiibacteraceae bacterium]|nr:protein-glutamate O-methyltransferase CheR [Spongiibacteraceae bacterium]
MGRVLTALKKSCQTRAEQYSLNSKDFKYLCNLVYDTSGIVLDERKREMVYRRLMRRTRDLRLSSFSEYCQVLRSDGKNEFPKFINAITTNLTSFFREPHHFDYLKNTVVPMMLQKKQTSSDNQNKRLRIWSSACSTGEEPYSIAITLIQAMGPALNTWDTRILATDLDTDVLETAKCGIYRHERIEEISKKVQKKWFHKGSGKNDGFVKVNPQLSSLITFKQLNLLKPWPMQGPFDVIFCRNVLIYFDAKTQDELINRYYELLRPGGILFLGHSENIHRNFGLFELLGKTIFKKIPKPSIKQGDS